MEMNQQDYDERKRRVDEGTGDDEDARLVKLYESEGYEWQGGTRTQTSPDSTQTKPAGGEDSPSSTARTTGSRSNKGESSGSGTAGSAGSSSTGKAGR